MNTTVMANEHPLDDSHAPQIKEWLEILQCLPIRTPFCISTKEPIFLCDPRFRSRREIYKGVGAATLWAAGNYRADESSGGKFSIEGMGAQSLVI